MINPEDAREQLLSLIEIELCRIYDAGSKSPEKLKEFYDHIAGLPLSNIIFAWYRINAGKVSIKCIGEDVRIYKSDVDKPHSYSTRKYLFDALDELIDQGCKNEN